LQKLYCYVDETGQDTKGELFIVTVVILETERNEIRGYCEDLESKTRKGNQKWRGSRHDARRRYIEAILNNPAFAGKLMYSVFRDTRDYDLATVLGISKAIRWYEPEKDHAATVYIDGLSKNSRQLYSTELRKLGILTRKVMGVRRDENNALTRLADALAGFLRDAIGEESREAVRLLHAARRKGVLVEV
jgi:hypothetical protein